MPDYATILILHSGPRSRDIASSLVLLSLWCQHIVFKAIKTLWLPVRFLCNGGLSSAKLRVSYTDLLLKKMNHKKATVRKRENTAAKRRWMMLAQSLIKSNKSKTSEIESADDELSVRRFKGFNIMCYEKDDEDADGVWYCVKNKQVAGSKSIRIRYKYPFVVCQLHWILLCLGFQLDQIGSFALRGGFSRAHISCQPRLQPRNSCKMIFPVLQNSSSKTFL